MWPVWTALAVLGVSTGSLVAILVGFTGKTLYTNGWFWIAISAGTVAGLTALAFHTRSRFTRRMQTALIVSLTLHVLLTWVFRESYLSVALQDGHAVKVTVRPMPTMPQYYMPSPTGASVPKAHERPVQTTRAETSRQESVRNASREKTSPSYRPASTMAESPTVPLQATPVALERKSQAAPRRAPELSRLSRQEVTQAELEPKEAIHSPTRSIQSPQPRKTQTLDAPRTPAKRQHVARPTVRKTPAEVPQDAPARPATDALLARASRAERPQISIDTTAPLKRSQVDSTHIASTRARDVQNTPDVDADSGSSDMRPTLDVATDVAPARRERQNPTLSRRARVSGTVTRQSVTAEPLASVQPTSSPRRMAAVSPRDMTNVTASGLASRAGRRDHQATTSGHARSIDHFQTTDGPGDSDSARSDSLDGLAAQSVALARRQSGAALRTGRRGRSTSRSDADAEAIADIASSANIGNHAGITRRGDHGRAELEGLEPTGARAPMRRRSAASGSLQASDADAHAPQIADGDPSQNADSGEQTDDTRLEPAADGAAPRIAQRSSGKVRGPLRRGKGDFSASNTQAVGTLASPLARNTSVPGRDGPNESERIDLYQADPRPRRRARDTARLESEQQSVSEVPAMPVVATSEEDSASESFAGQPLEPESDMERVATRVRVRNHAHPGVGGLEDPLASSSGIPSRRASRQSPLVHNAPSRFLQKTASQKASLSGLARDIHPAYARRTSRLKDPARRGAMGAPVVAVEQSIELGLAYVHSIQRPDGRWSLQHTVPEGVPNPDPPPSLRTDTAATGLALLSFLGAGYTHLDDRYSDTVARGLEFLIANQKSNGDLFDKNSAMVNNGLWFYSHGIAAIALCEAYGMTGDPDLKQPAQKAIDFIVQAQHPERGGWRYAPNKMSDLSVSGWQLMALRSGQLAGLEVPESAIRNTQRLLDRAQVSPEDGSKYCYNPWGNDTKRGRYGPQANATMSAVGLMMRLYTGWEKDREEIQKGAAFLAERLPNADAPPDFSGMDNPRRDTYYWYSGTIVMYHVQGEYWKQWQGKLYPLLRKTQQREGALVGSWDPLRPVSDRWAITTGRLYLTTLNLLSLEVHHRHLPLFGDGLELAED